MSKHPISIPGFDTLEEAAEYIGNMRYDALRDLIGFLENKLMRDSVADHQRKRFILSSDLHEASYHLGSARVALGHAWNICKPYMVPDEPS